MWKRVGARAFALHYVMKMCILLFVTFCVSVVGDTVDATTTTDLGSEASARVSPQLPAITVMTAAPQEAASNAPVSSIAFNTSTLAPVSERVGDDNSSVVSDSASIASDDEEDYDSLGDDVDRPLAKIAANISQVGLNL